MAKSTPIWNIQKFDSLLERKYERYIERRARPIVAFIYWIGGILPILFILSDYFNETEKFEELLKLRVPYLIFWVLITIATISKFRVISLKKSLFIYVGVGIIYVTALNMFVLDRYMQVVPSALFYLFAIVLSQLGSRIAVASGLLCILLPALMLISVGKVGTDERTILIMMSVWSIASVVASLIMERINRRLFLYEQSINAANKENSKLLEQEAQSNRFKSEFLAKMSHEIRTPLTAILGYSESYFEGSLNRETRENTVKTIHQNGEHLLNIVNDILDLSKIEAGKLKVDKTETSTFEIIQQTELILQGLVKAKDLAFNVDYQYPIPDLIESDPARLKQVLLNLFGNAVKYTTQGAINLSVSYDIKSQQLEFSLANTLASTPSQLRASLYQAYAEADNFYSRNHGSMGLGFFISKQLISKLGGFVYPQEQTIASDAFSFSIKGTIAPRGKLYQQQPEHLTAQNQDSTHKEIRQLSGHILLVEDNIDNRRLIRLKLEQLGLEVTDVENGEQAVEAALVDDFNLILMDIEMPIMSGEDAIKIIQGTDSQTPIVALTANAMPQEIERYINLGFKAHLAKPIEQLRFIDTLTQYCQVTEDTITEPDEQKGLFSIHDVAYQKLLREYIEALPCEIEMLKHAKNAHDWQKLSKVAHSLKGAAGNFGFNAVSSEASKLESIIKAGRLGSVDIAFNSLMLELNEALYSNEK